MKPITIYLDFSNDEDGSMIVKWTKANHGLVMNTMLAACWEFANGKSRKEISLFKFVDIFTDMDVNELLYVISILPEDAQANLDECEAFFVQTEEYEKAANVQQCRKKLLQTNKNQDA